MIMKDKFWKFLTNLINWFNGENDESEPLIKLILDEQGYIVQMRYNKKHMDWLVKYNLHGEGNEWHQHWNNKVYFNKYQANEAIDNFKRAGFGARYNFRAKPVYILRVKDESDE